METSKFNAKTVLVTGAGGFIGSHLTEHLVKMGANVRVLLRYNSRDDRGQIDRLPDSVQNAIEVVWGDLRDATSVYNAVKGCDIVFHLGSLIAIPYSFTNPADYVQTNTFGTTNIMNACLEHRIEKVVHTSTSEVYGTAQYVPIDEKHPLQGQSPYSASKIGADMIAESFYRSFDLPVGIIRPFNTYGPRQSTRAIIPTIITQLINNKKEIQLGDLTPTRDLNFVFDTVRGFIHVAQSDNSVGQVTNIGSGREISIGDLVKKIGSLMGKDIVVTQDPNRMRPGKSEVERLLCDNTKAREILNWEPQVTLDKGLELTIDWIENNMERFKRVGKYTV